MLKSLLALSVSFWCLGAFAKTTEKSLGVGVILGDPTALTAKAPLSDHRAVDFGFGYHWHDSVLFYGDYLFLFPGSFKTENVEVNKIVPYVGVGAALALFQSDQQKRIGDNEANAVFAGRIPLGLSWMIAESPVELFAEVVPTIDVIPGLFFEVGGGLGVRIFF